MKTKRQVAEKQIELQERIQASGINVVSCGNCGSIMFHEISDESDIQCIDCDMLMAKCDCPDLWYKGLEGNYSDEVIDDEEVYLGQIESGISNLKVYATSDNYRLEFFSNGNLMSVYNGDDIWVELRTRGYKKYFCKAVLSML